MRTLYMITQRMSSIVAVELSVVTLMTTDSIVIATRTDVNMQLTGVTHSIKRN